MYFYGIELKGEKQGEGKVIGEFICDEIITIKPLTKHYSFGYFSCLYDYDIDDDRIVKTCLTQEDLKDYGKGKPLYGLHISNLKIYDKPKELFDFNSYSKYQICKERNCFSGDCWTCPNNAIMVRPPQSWCYVEESESNLQSV
ncbi:MAG: hypothetical protein SPL13_04270 [Clostridia bacterium]|nr:hypothetical protein [Clostridia bacterium]